jgi:arylsulfatase A-like enzyme
MKTSDRPNVLVIFCDQLRRDALSCFGDQDLETPNIDALAKSGVRFKNACSTYPICVPFRFTLMTGQYAHSRFIPGIEWRMSPSERTLADEVNENGYESIYIGKWHLYGGHGLLPRHTALKANRTPVPREHQGRWQKWFGFEVRNGPFDTCYFEDNNPIPHPIKKYQTDGCFDLAMDYLRDRPRKDRPFFCVISVEPPHPPYEAPKELEEKWRDRNISLPPNFTGANEAEKETFIQNRKMYYAMIENLDQNVGRMLKYLEDRQLNQNTIIVFMSDHGELGGAHGLKGKQLPYEESIGIPLIIKDPRFPEGEGKMIEEPTCTEDLFPTLLGLIDIQPKNHLFGLNLAPLIQGKETEVYRQGVLLEYVAEFRAKSPLFNETWRGFRGRRYKYTVKGNAEGSTAWQFFDLEKDPYEITNLIENSAYQSEIQKFHQLLRAELVRTQDHFVLSPMFGCDGLNLWKNLV